MDGAESDLNQPTEREKGLAKVNAKMFNQWVKDLPFEDAYYEDIIKSPEARVAKVQGETNADVMQSVGTGTPDPTRSVAAQDITPKVGGVMSKAMTNASEDVQMQRLAGAMDLTKMGMGDASTAQTAMTGMAKSAVDRAVSDSQADWQAEGANYGAVSSMVGGITGGVTAGMRKTPTTTPTPTPTSFPSVFATSPMKSPLPIGYIGGVK